MQSENKAQPTQQFEQIAPNSIPCEIIGCLSLEPIWSRLKNPQETTYYIAGPPAMIQALTENLLKKDITPEMIKVDAWD